MTRNSSAYHDDAMTLYTPCITATGRRWIITVTSLWAQWRLKSPTRRLFAQTFVQAQIKENIQAPCHWPLWGESTGDWWFPSQRNAEKVSIWQRHHDYEGRVIQSFGAFLLVSMDKLLNKQSYCLWFETPQRSCHDVPRGYLFPYHLMICDRCVETEERAVDTKSVPSQQVWILQNKWDYDINVHAVFTNESYFLI